MNSIRFHELTKHTPLSVRRSGHRLDWSNKPHPFKEYLDVAPLPLPAPAADTEHPASESIVERPPRAERPLDAREIARLLVLSAGVLRSRAYPDGERVYFRTYASAGALYPIEVYLACGEVEGLEPALYHFHPLEKALRPIRAGDPRPYLVRATGGSANIGAAPLSLVLSGIPWRTTWKYGARGYRHLYWDAGMILANSLALAASGGHGAEVVLGFVDGEVNALLGVDGRSEMALAVVPIGARAANLRTGPAGSVAPAVDHVVQPLSRQERVYRELVEVHEETSLHGPEEAAAWSRPPGAPRGRVPPRDECRDGLERVIRRRGSSRAFARVALPADQLAGVLSRSRHRLSADWGPPLVELAIIINAAEGLAPGRYRLGERGLERSAGGDFRDHAYFLCLEQALGGDSAATYFLVADLERVVGALGGRGYRAAQLEAGIAAGRAVLGAYECRFGATGLTFYDDEVRKFFDTEAEPMLAVALGRPAKRRRLL